MKYATTLFCIMQSIVKTKYRIAFIPPLESLHFPMVFIPRRNNSTCEYLVYLLLTVPNKTLYIYIRCNRVENVSYVSKKISYNSI